MSQRRRRTRRRRSSTSQNNSNRNSVEEILIKQGILSETELLEIQAKTGEHLKLSQALVDEGIITEQSLIELLSEELSIPTIDLYSFEFSDKILKLVSKSFAQGNELIPLEKKERTLLVAMADPLDYAAITDLRLLTGLKVRPLFATRTAINMSIAQHYGHDSSIDDWMEQESEQAAALASQEEASATDDAPIIKLVNSILENAVDRQVSDIHFDPQEHELVVRIRIDGQLVEDRRLPKNVQNAVLSRIKIISSLDITESRLPQDGRAQIKVGNKRVDLRVSFLPTVYGEKVVIRVLEMSAGVKRLRNLGFSEYNFKEYQKLIKKPHGMILLTGPTGSGKSSTLYASLTELNEPSVNIITVEDPVEYQLEGINQVQANSQIGLTFAAGLRSILRQDPDIIMLGEIRDGETAEMSVRAAMTGHLVLSTLHTNDAIGSVSRLTDMGVDPFLVATSLAGVVSQRLVRTICSSCKKKRRTTLEEEEYLKAHDLIASDLYEGSGCPTCGMSGYRGRMALQELFVVTPEIRRLITNEAAEEELVASAHNYGMQTLLQDGLAKAVSGQTTIEEVLRVAAGDE